MKFRHLFITLALVILIMCIFMSDEALTQDPHGTSALEEDTGGSVQNPAVYPQVSGAITFSEYPIGTAISNQYANRGILFGGDNPFIWTDSSNPTSPVLSGSPRYRGDIEGKFVNPNDGTTPVIVEAFSFDAGYFNEFAGTRIEWFDPYGIKLGQRTNFQFGIERFTVTGGNIASWRISIIETEPFGYAIDNVSFEPSKNSVLFREIREKDGTWGFLKDEIPGFDHVALNVDNLVYESHPGYPSGVYYSEDGKESANIETHFGVQAEHTKGTFKYDRAPGKPSSPVEEFEEIPIDEQLAKRMQTHIQTKITPVRAEFQQINFSSLNGIKQTLAPSVQKGGNGKFTCVGLVEWAAEESGHLFGQGFILDPLEAIGDFPLLSPQLLNYAMKFPSNIEGINQWFQGIFDPVDFMITDPLGRKLGYIATLGNKNEIPKAFFTGDGELEQFLIPNPVPGTYQVELIGLNDQVSGAISSSSHSETIDRFLTQDQKVSMTFDVFIRAGSPGDMNRDLCIDQKDVTALSAVLNTFASSPNDPGDLDGDGIIGQSDKTLLNQLVAFKIPCTEQVFLPIIVR